MKSRFLGALFLISGTTIGAGMLALPVTTGMAGFFPSLILMVMIWLYMMLTAFYLLEVNLKMQGNVNFISMVHKTLGRPGEMVAWVFYLLLLYALTAAYLLGCSHIVMELLGQKSHGWIWPLALFFLFSLFLYFGTHMVDMTNRLFMLLLFGSYLFLFLLGIGHIKKELLTFSCAPALVGSASVMLTSFGYHIIIPSLTNYLGRDAKLLTRAILWGSLIPLIVYISWQLLAVGIIPLKGECSLEAAKRAGHPATFYLKAMVQSPYVTTLARLFGTAAIVTSLLGVSLSLSDFLADGLKIKKDSRGKCLLILLTLTPPLFFALFFPRGFILALNYAGLCVLVLLALLPILMTWSSRYGKKEGWSSSTFKVGGGKKLLLFSFAMTLVLFFVELQVL